MPVNQQSPGVTTPSELEVLELHVAKLDQLFNAMDPAPFRDRDLDPSAEEYIVGWSREARAGAPLGLLVHLNGQEVTPDTAAILKQAVHEFFRQRATATRQQLRQLFRNGRVSLLIGLLFLAIMIVMGDFFAGLISRERYAYVVQESLLIGGWVALWRPLEIFLYDWWPIRAEARLYDRLSAMAVRVVGANAADANASA
jgi:hypothetical protein